MAPVDGSLVGQTLSHYRVLEKLGEGGMGVVYRALDTRLERTVALKVPPPQSLDDPERKARFIREARAAAALEHPSIVTIYEVDSDRGIDFIAMEFVAGDLLQQRTKGAAMPVEERSGWRGASRRPSLRPTRPGSCTGTSSLPTSSSRKRAGSRYSTSDWLSCAAAEGRSRGPYPQ